PARQFFLSLLHRLVNLSRNATQIASLHGAENVDDGLDVIVRDHGGSDPAIDRCQAGQNLRTRSSSSGYRNILQTLQRVDPVLRRLRGDRITHPSLRIEPERGRGLETPTQ